MGVSVCVCVVCGYVNVMCECVCVCVVCGYVNVMCECVCVCVCVCVLSTCSRLLIIFTRPVAVGFSAMHGK